MPSGDLALDPVSPDTIAAVATPAGRGGIGIVRISGRDLRTLAQALLGAGEHEAAEQAFARCLELDPQWMVAAIRRGRCLVALQRWDEARAALDRGAALAQAQNHDEPWAEIGELRAQIPA